MAKILEDHTAASLPFDECCDRNFFDWRTQGIRYHRFYDQWRSLLRNHDDHSVYYWTGHGFFVGECGCPAKMEAVITENEGNLHIDLAWFDKQANRIAEAIWVDFCPIGKNKRIRKLGSWIDPALVVKKGQHCLHGTDHGIRYDELEIQTLDAALIAPAGPSLLDFESKNIDGSGVSVNLYNNVWGTNFPMWYEENARFRFVLVPRKN